MNTKYIISLSILIALGGAHCRGAAANPEIETLTHPLARLYAEGSADQASNTLTSLYRKDLLELARIGLKEPQCFPNLYQDAMRELFGQKEKFRQLLRENFGNVQEALFDAAKNNKPWAIDYLIQNRADVDAIDRYGWTALMYAAEHGHEAVVTQLIAARADVNAKDWCDITTLMWAAIRNRGAVVAQLIAAGADVNAKNNCGTTALMWATMSNRSNSGAVVAQLIVAGANIDAGNNKGDTALSLAENAVINGDSQAQRDGARAVVDLLTRGR